MLIGVTVLTSMNQSDLSGIGIDAAPMQHVERLARLTQDSGLDGVVCSSHEVTTLKARFGKEFDKTRTKFGQNFSLFSQNS